MSQPVPASRRDRALTAANVAAGRLLTVGADAFPRLAVALVRLGAVVRNLALLLPAVLLGARLGRQLRLQYRDANRRARHGAGTVSHRYRTGVTRITYTVESILLSAGAERLGSDRFALGLTS